MAEVNSGLTPTDEQYLRDALRLSHTYLKRFPFLERGDLESYAMEGFLKAKRDYRPDKGASFGTFLSLVVKGKCLDLAKRERRYRGRFANIPEDREVADPGEERVDFSEEMLRALDTLEPAERYAVEARFLHGAKPRQTQQDLGLLRMALWRLEQRAQRKLRTALTS